MKRSHLLSACVATTLAIAPMAFAQDLAVTAGDHAKVVLENDKVRVIELNMDPGDATGMHSHKDHLVVYVSGGSAMQTMGDGSTKAIERKPGEVMWSGPVTHDTKNTGKAKVRTLVIEMKDPAP